MAVRLAVLACALLAGCAGPDGAGRDVERASHDEVDVDTMRCDGTANVHWSRTIPANTSILVQDADNRTVLEVGASDTRQEAAVTGAAGVWTIRARDAATGEGPHGARPPGNPDPVLEGTGGVGGDGYWLTVSC